MTGLVVRPVRFTKHMHAMQAFLELLGLRLISTADSGRCVDLACGSGRVALHQAAAAPAGEPPGQTTLSFGAADLDLLAAQVTDRGVAVVSLGDEAHGRTLTCMDPFGSIVAISEQMACLHGFQGSPATNQPRPITAAPVRFADPAGPYHGFLQALGMAPASEPSSYHLSFAAPGPANGQVRLHYAYRDDLPVVSGGPAAPVQLYFESLEPLAEIAARLSAAGFASEIITEKSGMAVLRVFDPDEQLVEVGAAPA